MYEEIASPSGHFDGQSAARVRCIVCLAGLEAEKRALKGSGSGWVRHRTALELIALHEGGHLVVGDRLGFAALGGSIVPDLGIHVGSGYRAGWALTRPRTEPVATVPVKMARSVETDRRKAASLALLLSDPMTWREGLATLRRLRQIAAILVNEHWLLIERVAAELLRHRTLGMSDIDQILNPRPRMFAPAETGSAEEVSARGRALGSVFSFGQESAKTFGCGEGI